MKRFCLALDLKDDPQLIREYENYHQPGNDWPEVTKNDRDAGIINLQIYRTGNRMFMIMETDDAFSFEKKAAMDAANPKVQEWEQLMWHYQVPLPWAKEGEKMGFNGQDIPILKSRQYAVNAKLAGFPTQHCLKKVFHGQVIEAEIFGLSVAKEGD